MIKAFRRVTLRLRIYHIRNVRKRRVFLKLYTWTLLILLICRLKFHVISEPIFWALLVVWCTKVTTFSRWDSVDHIFWHNVRWSIYNKGIRTSNVYRKFIRLVINVDDVWFIVGGLGLLLPRHHVLRRFVINVNEGHFGFVGFYGSSSFLRLRPDGGIQSLLPLRRPSTLQYLVALIHL